MSRLTLALLLGCVTLLQYHSIRFWSARVDPLTGWGWSLLLEAIAAWLWFRPGLAYRGLGLLASVLLLAGPMYQVSDPLIQGSLKTQQADSSHAAQLALNERLIQDLGREKMTYLDNSTKRPGWGALIQDVNARLDHARRQRDVLETRLPLAATTLPWQQRAIIGMQALALILYQVTAVLAITSLAKPGKAKRARETVRRRKSNIVKLSRAR